MHWNYLPSCSCSFDNLSSTGLDVLTMGDLETYIHIVLYITAINTTGFNTSINLTCNWPLELSAPVSGGDATSIKITINTSEL